MVASNASCGLDKTSPQNEGASKMTDREKLQQDIDALKERVRLAWLDLALNPLMPGERIELRKHASALVYELTRLLERLDQLDSQQIA